MLVWVFGVAPISIGHHLVNSSSVRVSGLYPYRSVIVLLDWVESCSIFSHHLSLALAFGAIVDIHSGTLSHHLSVFFDVQGHFSSAMSFRVTILGIHIHWHCTPYLHGYALILVFPHLVTPCLSHIHHVVHIGWSPLNAFCRYSRVVRPVLIFDIDLQVTFGDILEGAWILSVASEAFWDIFLF